MRHTHTGIENTDVSNKVILTESPGKVQAIAALLDDWEDVAFNREYRVVKGSYKDDAFTVVSAGIGGRSASDAMEELICCGAEWFVWFGSLYEIHPKVQIGDVVVATSAMRCDSASRRFITDNYPAVSDYNLLNDIIPKNTISNRVHVGVVRSTEKYRFSNEDSLMHHWHDNGVLGTEVCSASLMVLSQLKKVRFASVLKAVSRTFEEAGNDHSEHQESLVDGERLGIKLILDGLSAY